MLTDQIHRHQPLTDALPEFLDGFVAVHAATRRSAAALAMAARSLTNARDARLLDDWFVLFRRAVEHHHRREDDTLWPELGARSPEFAAQRPLLEHDHALLGQAFDRLASLLTAARAWPKSLVPTADRHIVQAAQALSDLLHDHLERDEAAAFPRLAECFTAEEFAAIEQRFAGDMSLRDMAFAGPWVLEGAPDHRTATLFDGVAPPVRALVGRVFVPHYRRLSAVLDRLQ